MLPSSFFTNSGHVYNAFKKQSGNIYETFKKSKKICDTFDPMTINYPNHKPIQYFYFTESNDIKHVIGKHKQRIKSYRHYPGISKIKFIKELTNIPSRKIGEDDIISYAKLLIEGTPEAVDNLKKEIEDWIFECYKMCFDYIDY